MSNGNSGVSNLFFRIVGVTSSIMAGLSLLAAVIFALIAAPAWLSGADDELQSPALTVDQYKAAQSSDTQDTATPEQSSRPADSEEAAEQEAFDNEYNAHFQRMVRALNRFANSTGQGSVNRDALWEHLVSQGWGTQVENREEMLTYISSLADAMEDLAAKASEIARLDPGDQGHVAWDEYLFWAIDHYEEEMQTELERVQMEHQQQSIERTESLVQLAVAGSAFTTFVLFTMILLLVRIEANTRNSE